MDVLNPGDPPVSTNQGGTATVEEDIPALDSADQ